MHQMKLSEMELRDPVWLKIAAYLELRLFDLRKQNDADLTQDQTVKLRGKIFEVKKLLDIGNPKTDNED